MNTDDKISILAKSRKGRRRSSSTGKRNAVPTKSGGRKDVSQKGGGAKAALMRRIHRDPDIQKLLKKNPRYDIIVVKKVTAGVEEEFEAREKAKKDLLQARKDLLVAKRSKDLAKEKEIRARIVELESASLSEHDKGSLKMHDDWHKEQVRRKQVGGYD
jgi:hypothetical protein